VALLALTSVEQDTTLHSGKDLAVSLLMFPQELIPKDILMLSYQNVSARTSWITPDGNYPLPFYECPDFPNPDFSGLD